MDTLAGHAPARPQRSTLTLTTDTAERPAVPLAAADVATLGQALADAQAYRRERAESYCYDCAQHPAGACESHLGDLDIAGQYEQLAGLFEVICDAR